MTRVLGVVMARDEWPALAMTIAHALTLVDQVLVVDHDSIDDTPQGLASMQHALGDRITVVRAEHTPYWQEAITNLAIALRGTDDVDWIYVFDADEFLLLPDGLRLADLLEKVPSHCTAVRYEVQNFVVPHTFDADDIWQYRTIQHRSIACETLGIPHEIAVDEIEHGHLNYFDLPFASKVIVRAGADAWIAAGSHDAFHGARAVEHRAEPDEVRAAHLPFSGFTALADKVAHGRRLRDQGFPPYHGWQSQMLARLADEGRLEQFWAAHSIGGDIDTDTVTPPTTVVDLGLARVAEVAAAVLAPIVAEPAVDGPELLGVITHDAALVALRAAQLARGASFAEVRSLEGELVAQRAALAGTRRRHLDAVERADRLHRELDALRTEHRALRDEADDTRHTLIAARAVHDRLGAEFALLDAHRADLQRELDAVRATLVWRWTGPLRSLRAKLRRRR